MVPDDDSEERSARDWIAMVEGEGGRVRERDLFPALRSWVEGVGPTAILDIGSGQGMCSAQIDLTHRRYTGIEPSPVLLARARELYSAPGRRFLAGSAESLPVSDASMDAAFSIAVWHLLGDLQGPARELGRVLKAGAAFLIVTAHPEQYPAWTGRYAEGKQDGKRFEGRMRLADGSSLTEVLYLHRFEEIDDALRAAGLRIEETRALRYFLWLEGRKLS